MKTPMLLTAILEVVAVTMEKIEVDGTISTKPAIWLRWEDGEVFKIPVRPEFAVCCVQQQSCIRMELTTSKESTWFPLKERSTV